MNKWNGRRHDDYDSQKVLAVCAVVLMAIAVFAVIKAFA